jgi:CheY-like chemotaxis protein
MLHHRSPRWRNRMLLKDVLEYFGYEVVEAGNGEEGK